MKNEFHNGDINGLMNDVLKSAVLLNKEIESYFGQGHEGLASRQPEASGMRR